MKEKRNIQQCPICDSQLGTSSRRDWRVRPCENCGFQFGETAFRYQFVDYQNDYFDDSNYVDFRVRARAAFEYTARKRFADLQRLGIVDGAKDIVEIGCSTGEFLGVANQNSHRVAGHDSASNAVKAAKEQYGVDATSNFNDLALHSFDIVCAFHVIEHVDNPVDFVKGISELLRPNGILYLRMPHIQSLSSSILKSNWPGLSIEHVNFFNLQSVGKLLDRTNYELLHLATESHARFLLGGLRRFVKGGSRPHGGVNRGSNSTPSQRDLKLMKNLNLPYTPIAALERMTMRGDELIVIAQQKS